MFIVETGAESWDTKKTFSTGQQPAKSETDQVDAQRESSQNNFFSLSIGSWLVFIVFYCLYFQS